MSLLIRRSFLHGLIADRHVHELPNHGVFAYAILVSVDCFGVSEFSCVDQYVFMTALNATITLILLSL